MAVNRRGLLGGILGLVAGPAVIRAEALMPVRPFKLIRPEPLFLGSDLLLDGLIIRYETPAVWRDRLVRSYLRENRLAHQLAVFRTITESHP